MKSFRIMFAAAALSFGLMSVCTAAPVTSVPQVQTPCRQPVGVQTCVVINKTVVSNKAGPANVGFDLTAANPLKGKIQSFSVVYAYRSARVNGDTITVMRGQNAMITDISANRPTYVWVTTRNGGKTWSKLETNDMDSVITY